MRGCAKSGSVRVAAAACAAILLQGPAPARAEDFEALLARVDHALKENPGKATGFAIDSCLARRNSAVRLYDSGQVARAERRLRYCIDTLGIPETPAAPVAAADAPPSVEEVQARAARELEQALALEPDIANGLEIYRSCAMCHMPEGWGLSNGSVPQLAGQHRTVVIKQLADIRAGNRDALLMLPYASVESIGGTQAVTDVAGYIDTLEIGVDNGKGPGEELELGEKIYQEKCARCHGAAGEGDAERFIPRIQSQHYEYLVRQLEWIREGKRRNADPEMAALVQELANREVLAVLDYVSRLQPPEELQAPPGWHNPDFSH